MGYLRAWKTRFNETLRDTSEFLQCGHLYHWLIPLIASMALNQLGMSNFISPLLPSHPLRGPPSMLDQQKAQQSHNSSRILHHPRRRRLRLELRCLHWLRRSPYHTFTNKAMSSNHHIFRFFSRQAGYNSLIRHVKTGFCRACDWQVVSY